MGNGHSEDRYTAWADPFTEAAFCAGRCLL